MSAMTTEAPSAAHRRAMALPIPLAPPVTMTTRPAREACDGLMPGSAIPGSAIPGSAIPGSAIPGSAIPGSAIPGSAIPGAAMLSLGRGLDLEEQPQRAERDLAELEPQRAERVGHRVQDRRRGRRGPAFPGALDSQRVERRRVALVHHVDVRHVGCPRQQVVKERAARELAVAVVAGLLEQRVA